MRVRANYQLIACFDRSRPEMVDKHKRPDSARFEVRQNTQHMKAVAEIFEMTAENTWHRSNIRRRQIIGDHKQTLRARSADLFWR